MKILNIIVESDQIQPFSAFKSLADFQASDIYKAALADEAAVVIPETAVDSVPAVAEETATQ